MRGTTKVLLIGLALAICMVFTAELFAAQTDLPPTGAVDIMELSAVGDPVSSEVLELTSGGQGMSIDTLDILVNNMKLSANIQGNLLYSTNTGLNQVSGEAFANASGITTVVQNSGNQVIINNALILNLQVQ